MSQHANNFIRSEKSQEEFQEELHEINESINERRKAIHAIRDDMQTLAGRIELLEFKLKDNTDITIKIQEETSEILDIFRSLKGGIRMLGWLGKGAGWATSIAIAIGTAYALFKKYTGG